MEQTKRYNVLKSNNSTLKNPSKQPIKCHENHKINEMFYQEND